MPTAMPEDPPARWPTPATPLVGRRRERAQARDLLGRPEVRLVTLTGPGGVGKTRLALELAAELDADFPDGAWFVPLDALADPALVASTIAQRLGIRETGSRPARDRLAAELRDREALLVLDGFEPVLPAAPELADLLAACPGVRLLVTSRTRLRLRGEHDLAVAPLPLPEPDPAGAGPWTADGALRSDAVRLFVERARAARPDFDLGPDDAPAVVELCARLDGLPLAIELAAARVTLLPPRALAARLERRLPLLTGGPRDLPARLRTLRDAVAWSYDLLDPPAQALFCRLAVLVGGFDLDAAAAVSRGAGEPGSRDEADSLDPLDSPAPRLLDSVAALVDGSLLRQVEQADGEPRFAMLETVREYGLERLAAGGDEEGTRASHAGHFLALADAAEPRLRGADQGAWLDRLDREHDNLRAALRWYEGRGELEAALRLAGALYLFWFMRGHLSEGGERLTALLALPGVPADHPARALALTGAGALLDARGDYGRAEALADEAISAWRAAGDESGLALALFFRAQVAFDRGDFATTWTLSEESLEFARRHGDRWTAAMSLAGLGVLALHGGDHDRAAAMSDESLALFRELGDRWGVAVATGNRAMVALGRGDHPRADALAGAALDEFRAVGNTWGIASYLEVPARSAAARGDAARAARLFGAATALRDAIGAPLKAPYALGHGETVAAVRSALGEDAFAAAWAAGRALTPEAAVALAREAPLPPSPPPRPGAAFGLSERELEVLRLFATGKSDREIAEALKPRVSHRTVTTHAQSIYNKLGVGTRTEAVAVALRQGLI